VLKTGQARSRGQAANHRATPVRQQPQGFGAARQSKFQDEQDRPVSSCCRNSRSTRRRLRGLASAGSWLVCNQIEILAAAGIGQPEVDARSRSPWRCNMLKENREGRAGCAGERWPPKLQSGTCVADLPGHRLKRVPAIVQALSPIGQADPVWDPRKENGSGRPIPRKCV